MLTTKSIRPFSNILNNSHLRYVPVKRMNFGHKSGDGQMCLIFSASDNKKSPLPWRLAMLSTIPVGVYAQSLVGALWTPLMILPAYLFHRLANKTQKFLEN